MTLSLQHCAAARTKPCRYMPSGTHEHFTAPFTWLRESSPHTACVVWQILPAPMFDLVTPLTERFEIHRIVVSSVLIPMMDEQIFIRPTSLTCIFQLLPVAVWRPAVHPHRIIGTYAERTFAFFRLQVSKALPRTGTGRFESACRDLELRTTVFAGSADVLPVLSGDDGARHAGPGAEAASAESFPSSEGGAAVFTRVLDHCRRHHPMLTASAEHVWDIATVVMVLLLVFSALALI